jgi:ParB family transcriptional regulator, chromosome partitioning protein
MRFGAGRMARAGVFVSLRSDGTLSVGRGDVRPEDEEPVAPVAGDALPGGDAAPEPVIITPRQPPAAEEDETALSIAERTRGGRQT